MDYDELEHALRSGSAARAPRAAAADVLGEIASGKRELRAVRHPLGFLCLPVVRDGERGVCVHLFGGEIPAGEPAAAGVHAHSWELVSHVLYGHVSNVPVRVTDPAAPAPASGPDAGPSPGPTHRVFEVHSAPDGTDELRPTGRLVRSEPGPEQTSTGGETYTLAAGEFHSTVVRNGEPAATLVLGRTLPDRSDLFLGPLHGPGHRTVRRLCGEEDTRRTVRAALRRVHAGHRE
ncbi:hypothetical protein [Streptomyces sp. WMMB 322]|uniref:hypothetical protein n=1 Tax=Streptomyces sp. WMMB 322 TaxID=1286821 RepID=UPI0006E1CC5E|nr:hypothetical protein [Streptomyces sp. WMMB 322]SCK42055.1 hypothetical protein H180DRAFT_03648 [Streptomyces sp. WMMB 322]